MYLVAHVSQLLLMSSLTYVNLRWYVSLLLPFLSWHVSLLWYLNFLCLPLQVTL